MAEKRRREEPDGAAGAAPPASVAAANARGAAANLYRYRRRIDALEARRTELAAKNADMYAVLTALQAAVATVRTETGERERRRHAASPRARRSRPRRAPSLDSPGSNAHLPHAAGQ
jgi:hypothetical protein